MFLSQAPNANGLIPSSPSTWEEGGVNRNSLLCGSGGLAGGSPRSSSTPYGV